MSKPDGGQAFPELTTGHDGPSGTQNHRTIRFESAGGMTLRDYFAGQALIGHLAQPHPDYHGDHGPGVLASDCYATADAMLQERDR